MGRRALFIYLVISLLALDVKADIFGEDNRRDPIEGSLDYDLSKSVAVGVLTSFIENNILGGFDIYTKKLSSFMCMDERFASQDSLAYACTGFLVGPDLLMTAGHCSTNYEEIFNFKEGYCESYKWLFDHVQTSTKKLAVQNIPYSKLYSCKQILYAVADEDERGRDFALIQLDRPVEDRNYLTLASESIKVNEPVKMIGAPLGMSLKITDSAKVVKNDINSSSFLTDLDAFQGNSGSPVFNKENKVVGVLVSGSPGEVTYKDEVNKCERYNYCDQNGENCMLSFDDGYERGSDVEKLFKYRDVIEDYVDFNKKRRNLNRQK